MKILLATGNRGKGAECLAILSTLLDSSDVKVIVLKDVPAELMPDGEPVEDAETFAGNAQVKSVFYYEVAMALGCDLVVGEDSGLMVEAIPELLGVRSARWVSGSDADRNAALLDTMNGIADRNAAYVCAISAIVVDNGQIIEVEGRCDVVVTEEVIDGPHGFGYDPVTRSVDLDYASLAVTPPEDKARISHRGKALRALAPELAQLL